ncbi:hypothetical protein L0657_13490 [Dyadobacter sp. CY345]|uniref:hypothetical protein n=1 Tax=Dyadobacter sp. CY345 TaxID=2909335 RepID=UPI001F24F776|nr:hypothetical protein [Dyadobacter sp. CY345]MCF2444976.1 hypothetical protein [Dyadobacter sp. CY345]
MKYICLVLFSLVWLVGLSPSIYAKLGEWNLINDGYQFGDLYRLSNLPQFKDPVKPCPKQAPVTKVSSAKKVCLYIIGDSFTEKERVGKEDFAVDEYQYVHWDNILHLKPDTTKTNILLMECVERHFREKMASPIHNIIPDSATFVMTGPEPSFMQKLDHAFAADPAETRLDVAFFQNDWMLKIKEMKAAFTYHFFHRADKKVTLVNNDNSLVYYMDTDTPKSTSSFSKLADTELDTIMTNLAESHSIAKKLGFDHVVLSIIPNKVSVIMPEYGQYNQLISRVYAHPKLDMPYVDVLPDFRRMKENSYLKGDSHWTCQAQEVWLTKTNDLIKKVAQEN